jgi:uncharacterized protein
MSQVFVDTSAYFAFVNQNDAAHEAAVAAFHRLGRAHDDLFTTNFVLAETHALILRKMGRLLAGAFLHELDASTTHVVRVSVSDERRARMILVQYHDKDFSLTDALSFAVMERLHITLALTFDHHFAQFGFTQRA